MPKVAKKIVLDGEEVNIPVGGGSSFSIPSGVIWPWYHTEDQAVPDGWALCNGENGTPDLRGRFLLGASDTHVIGSTGGSEEVTLTEGQMPRHNHAIYSEGNTISNKSQKRLIAEYRTPKTEESNGYDLPPTTYTGSSQPHTNMPPYFAIDYIMKL